MYRRWGQAGWVGNKAKHTEMQQNKKIKIKKIESNAKIQLLYPSALEKITCKHLGAQTS